MTPPKNNMESVVDETVVAIQQHVTKYKGKVSGAFLDKLLTDLLLTQSKAQEEIIEAIFSGNTIEYKGKFFKISDQDALNFIKWKETLTHPTIKGNNT